MYGAFGKNRSQSAPPASSSARDAVSPEPVVHRDREDERDPGEEEVPDQRAVVRAAAVEDAHPDHCVDEERQPEQRPEDREAPVAHCVQLSPGEERAPGTAEAVVGDRLPVGCVVDELAVRGPDARVLVEGGHPDPDRLLRVGEAAPERRAARGAEDLWEPVLRLVSAE